MDWQKRMNRAMEYIENNLSSKIDYYVAAQFMNCSESASLPGGDRSRHFHSAAICEHNRLGRRL